MGLKKLYKLYKLIIIVFFAFLVVSANAQVSQRSFDAIQNPVGGGGYAKLGANASVYVCTYNTELTCNSGNYITVFSDNPLLHPITQPVRADLNGVYQYFIAAGTQVVEKVCFTASQCQSYYIYFSAGGGGGGISGGGTAGYLPVWTGATSLGNSVVKQTSTTPLNTLNFLDSSGATESQMLMPLGSDDVIIGQNATFGSLGYGNDSVIIGSASAMNWGTLTSSTDAVNGAVVLGNYAGWGLLGGATSGQVVDPIFIGSNSGNSMLYNATSGGVSDPICIGNNSCPNVHGSNVNDLIAIGSNSAEGLNGCGEVISLGDNSASTCTNSINLVSIGINSAATSTNTTNGIAIGNNSGEGWTGSTPGSNREIIAIGTNAGGGVSNSTNVIGIGAYVTDAVSGGSDDVFGYGYNSVEGIGAGSSEIIGVGTNVAAIIGAGSDDIIGIGQNVGNNLGAASSDVIQIGHRSADNGGAVLTNAIAIGMQNNSASYQAVIGDPTITSLYLFGSHPASGGPYCLQQDSTGHITNTGAACGGGGGGFSNPMTALGDVIYGGASGAATRLAGNTTTTPQCLIQTGTGSASAAPVWGSCGGGSSVSQIIAGTNVTISPTGGTGAVTINASGGSGAIHAQITVGTTSVPANSCLPTATTYSTATMTGVTTSMVFTFGWSANYSGVSGWTPATPGLYFTSYPTANTLNYQVCNATSTAIVPGSSTIWNVSAQ